MKNYNEEIDIIIEIIKTSSLDKILKECILHIIDMETEEDPEEFFDESIPIVCDLDSCLEYLVKVGELESVDISFIDDKKDAELEVVLRKYFNDCLDSSNLKYGIRTEDDCVLWMPKKI